MRKLVGFICFILSLAALVAIVITQVGLYQSIHPTIEETDLFAIFLLYFNFVWPNVIPSLTVLLLSVIAMGNYKGRN